MSANSKIWYENILDQIEKQIQKEGFNLDHLEEMGVWCDFLANSHAIPGQRLWITEKLGRIISEMSTQGDYLLAAKRVLENLQRDLK